MPLRHFFDPESPPMPGHVSLLALILNTMIVVSVIAGTIYLTAIGRLTSDAAVAILSASIGIAGGAAATRAGAKPAVPVRVRAGDGNGDDASTKRNPPPDQYE